MLILCVTRHPPHTPVLLLLARNVTGYRRNVLYSYTKGSFHTYSHRHARHMNRKKCDFIFDINHVCSYFISSKKPCGKKQALTECKAF